MRRVPNGAKEPRPELRRFATFTDTLPAADERILTGVFCIAWFLELRHGHEKRAAKMPPQQRFKRGHVAALGPDDQRGISVDQF
jgi:hypothetical protein